MISLAELELLAREGCWGRGGAADVEPLESVRACEAAGPWRRSRTVAEGADGARCDLRLLCSIMDMAQASRSTGVRLAAWRKASCSCADLSRVVMRGVREDTYVEFFRRGPPRGVFH